MKNNYQLLLKYAGLATQFAIAIGIAIFFGVRLDAWIEMKNPIFTWVFPLIFIIVIIYKIIKDTAPKSKN